MTAIPVTRSNHPESITGWSGSLATLPSSSRQTPGELQLSVTPRASIDLPRRSAVRFIVLLGVVSLFADMTYEGARSVTGPYLGILGASAAIVGIVA